MSAGKKIATRAAKAAPMPLENKRGIDFLKRWEKDSALLGTSLREITINDRAIRSQLVDKRFDVEAIVDYIRENASYWTWRRETELLRLGPKAIVRQAQATRAVIKELFTRIEHMNAELFHELRGALDMEDPGDVYRRIIPELVKLSAGLEKAARSISASARPGRKPRSERLPARSTAVRSLALALRRFSTPKVSVKAASALAEDLIAGALDWPARK